MNNFTPRAQQVLALARKEADRFGHTYVDTTHMLLGTIKLGQGLASNVLTKMGLTLEEVRKEVERQYGSDVKSGSSGNIPYTPAVKVMLARANKEAKKLNHSYVGSEHLLLSLLRLTDGGAAIIFDNLKFDTERAREIILSEIDPNFSPAVDETHFQALEFTLWIDPGVATVSEIQELFSAASDLHRVLGGQGLSFVKSEQETPILLSAQQ
jgi:ATP-dependent Clp protease ATP-binding subunit ClpC